MAGIHAVFPSVVELIGEGPLQCPSCDREYAKGNNYHQHVVRCHQLCDPGAGHLQLRFHCPVPICCKNGARVCFGSWRSLKQHYWKLHLDKNLVCRFCKYFRSSLERDRKYHEKNCVMRPYQLRKTPAVKRSTSTETPTKAMEIKDCSDGKMTLVVIAKTESSPETPGCSGKLRRLLPNPRAPSPVPRFCPIAPKRSTREVGVQVGESVFRSVQVQSEMSPSPLPQLSMMDFICQTAYPGVVDASVSADLSESELAAVYRDAILLSTMETQTEQPGVGGTLDVYEFDEILRNIETQTVAGFLTEVETQTSNLEISSTTHTQTADLSFF